MTLFRQTDRQYCTQRTIKPDLKDRNNCPQKGVEVFSFAATKIGLGRYLVTVTLALVFVFGDAELAAEQSHSEYTAQ